MGNISWSKAGFFQYLMLILFAFFVDVVVNGYIFSVMWRWFITPLGFPVINVGWGMGISALVLLLTRNNSRQDGIHILNFCNEKIRFAFEVKVILACLGQKFAWFFAGWIAYVILILQTW